jgi:acetoacetyl-CoA synthetase
VEKLPSVRKVVVVPHLDPKVDVSEIPKAVTLGEWLRRYTPADIAFAQLPFDHPVFILFTSGTTGKPKCIVHGAGGTLLQALKMFKLHFDLRPGERYFYYCTTNWVVWNLLFMALAAEASVMLYDGSPFARTDASSSTTPRRSASRTSAPRPSSSTPRPKRGLRPRDTHDLGSVRMILSTGSPLAPEGFDYVYDAVKSDACLASISGGTDIMGAFADASAVLPVYRGELQCRSLGMAVEVFDEEGNSVVGKKGELVCTRPFPSMPLGFWNDRGGERYHAAYFAKYPASGPTATGPSSPSAAPCWSTGAPTPLSIPAVCASAPRRSTAWSSASTRSRRPSPSGSSGRPSSPPTRGWFFS